VKMNLDLNFEQDMLRTAAQDFFGRQYNLDTAGKLRVTDAGYSVDMWRQMADLGWHGVLIPEDHGGIGLSMLEMAILAMEIGAAACPGPFFTSSIFSALLLAEAADEAWQSALLPGMAAGERIATVACCGATHHFQITGVPFSARRSGGGWILDGRALFVPYAHIADTLIVAARAEDDNISLFVINQGQDGVTIEGLESIAAGICAAGMGSLPPGPTTTSAASAGDLRSGSSPPLKMPSLLLRARLRPQPRPRRARSSPRASRWYPQVYDCRTGYRFLSRCSASIEKIFF
jgi:alkylation response protein AidB-like acyl-CoA dehydrogenase